MSVVCENAEMVCNLRWRFSNIDNGSETNVSQKRNDVSWRVGEGGKRLFDKSQTNGQL